MAGDPWVIALWSPKGGVGKTTLATALALQLSDHVGAVLVDGNADNPDVVSCLQCSGQPSVVSWPGDPDPARVESYLVRRSKRLWVLPGPPRFSEESALSGPVMESVLRTLRSAGLHVVVDLSTSLRDSTLAALDLADVILMPVTLDLLALTPVRRLQRELELLRLDGGKIRLIVNRVTNTPEITLSDVAEVAPFPVVGDIPSSRELATAVNRGEAVAGLAPGTVAGKAVERLLRAVCPAAVSIPAANGQPGAAVQSQAGGGADAAVTTPAAVTAVAPAAGAVPHPAAGAPAAASARPAGRWNLIGRLKRRGS